MRFGWKISAYILRSVLPYFIFSWLLLSVILFVQQASRYSDIYFSANIPSTLVWQLTAALIPNVIAFTCPMAALVGVVIGLAKMQGDSELVAIRAAGIGNLHVSAPLIFLGVALSLFAFAVNIFGVPLAAAAVRAVALRAAIYKLESPLEPGVFNTEVAGYTIYVKDGDVDTGRWRNIFVHTENPETGEVRLITSSGGRIDSTDEQSELVLEDAVSSTFNTRELNGKFVSEVIGEVRLAIKTRRGELIERLQSSELSAEEIGLGQFGRYAEGKTETERREAGILAQRRITLSISPLLFCILGGGLILRFNRAGRGFGIVLALAGLIGFYVFAFLGEQLARSGWISTFAGGMMPIVASLIAIAWFYASSRVELLRMSWGWRLPSVQGLGKLRLPKRRANVFVDLTTGLRDFDLIVNILKYYALSLVFLGAIFLIFTAFELWRFAGSMDGGFSLLLQYLGYLIPFVYLQLAPSAAMIAILATYVIKSRQNEIVTWTGAGQSVYRLLFPAFVLMLILGAVNLLIQESVAPGANRTQEELRTLIRDRGKVKIKGRQWIATETKVFSFESITASDNESAPMGDGLTGLSCVPSCKLRNVAIYEFVDKGAGLQTLYRGESAVWEGETVKFTGPVLRSDLRDGAARTSVGEGTEVSGIPNPIVGAGLKPSQMAIGEVRERMNFSDSEVERRSFRVALQKKYTTLFLPFVIALFTSPFALSLSRKGKAATVGYAVGLWLAFMGITSVFEQLGAGGSLSPEISVWAPLAAFALLGTYLLSTVRT